ncbi:MAG: hypothetical protein ACK4UN_10335 [Limisphaerales bacterium]
MNFIHELSAVTEGEPEPETNMAKQLEPAEARPMWTDQPKATGRWKRSEWQRQSKDLLLSVPK